LSIGDILLTRALIRRARGDVQEAAREASTARTHFRAALPPDHPLVRQAAEIALLHGPHTPRYTSHIIPLRDVREGAAG
jgi:hypothetical protein